LEFSAASKRVSIKTHRKKETKQTTKLTHKDSMKKQKNETKKTYKRVKRGLSFKNKTTKVRKPKLRYTNPFIIYFLQYPL